MNRMWIPWGALMLLAVPAVATAQADSTCNAGQLSALVSYTDLRVRSVLHALELLAATREVKSGSWQAMSDLVSRFEKSDGGLAAWYMRRDGRYYAVGKGLVDSTLRDREYFPDLVAGREIVAALVISKSTGQRSAVIAVPLRQGNRVVGAIGASLFLDRLSDQIDSTLALRPNQTFYALAPTGLTPLNRRTDLHFRDPREMGSETLRRAANEMLSKASGEVTYEFEGVTKRALFRRSALTQWTFAVATNLTRN